MAIVVVVPTIRPESFERFKDAWRDLFLKHSVDLLSVWDGDNPHLERESYYADDPYFGWSVEDIMGGDANLIYNKNDGCRNLGFWYVAKFLPDVKYIITLDDDVLPVGDTIQDHIDALNMRVPVSWITTGDKYTRGFPYCVREEAEVVLSHGVWNGVKDWDAPTQLVMGNPDMNFYKGSIPKGVYYPMCGMNIAFKRKLLPYMYYAPMGYRVGMDRFADIWCGIESKRVIDKNGWAVVTGYASVQHDRASNVFKNLQKEAKGLELNETYWKGEEKDPYFKLYKKKRTRWERLMRRYV